jgi:hypothetical protein
MNLKWLMVLVMLMPGICSGQSQYTIPLAKENSSLAIPSMAEHDGLLYVAYRSFDWLRFSSRLQVLAYDLRSHKERQHVTIPVPKVRGARAAEGLFLSKDGKMLAYSEAYTPTLLLLLSTKNLSVIRRSTALPFTPKDLWRQFAGFDNQDLLAFASISSYRLRFIRIRPTNLNPVSDVRMNGPETFEPFSIVWSPSAKLTWISSVSVRGDQWQEYTEDGLATGRASGYRREISNGAVALGEGKLLAFYGNMIAKGTVVSYSDHHTGELKLECVPRSYGISEDPEYAGALCTTSPDREPDNAGDRILSSEFLLLRVDGPTVVWSHKMSWLAVANGNGPHDGWQKGDPLICRLGKRLWIIAPTKSSELAVYEVALTE